MTGGEGQRRHWARRAAIVAASLAATAFVGGSIVIASIAGQAPGRGAGPSTGYAYGSDRPAAPTAAWVRRRLAGSPPLLAALHQQGGQLIDGGLEARLRELRGRPVVVNAWASWCAPCRDELPLLSRIAAHFGRRVAFLGADVDDSSTDAHTVLAGDHLSYPSYRTTATDVRDLAPVAGFPTTIYLARDGHVVGVHPGQYPDAKALAADVARYRRR